MTTYEEVFKKHFGREVGEGRRPTPQQFVDVYVTADAEGKKEIDPY